MMRIVFSIFLVFFLGCINGIHLKQSKIEKTCLVLSVGSTKGLAHIGAINAIKDMGIQIDCVFGNSFGSIIGGIYAYDPTGNLELNVKRIAHKYGQLTEQEVKRSTETGFLAGLGLALITGGVFGLETIIGGVLGAFIGKSSIETFDNDRMERVLDNHFKYTNIDELLLPYATSYKVKEKSGLELYIAKSGNLAEAISRSSNNKYIFKNTNLNYIDPGVDRISTVPIEEAYKTFKPTRIIAINVSGAPAVYTNKVKCKVIEIKLDVNEVNNGSKKYINRQIDSLIKSGYNGTKEALSN